MKNATQYQEHRKDYFKKYYQEHKEHTREYMKNALRTMRNV